MTSGGAGGGGKAAAALRLQHYLIMAGVAAAVVLACLRYAPAAAGYGFLAVAPPAGAGRLVRAAADGGARDPPPSPSSVVIFNFGDSNSDTGGMAAVNGMNLNLPEGRTFFRRPTGRLSDGRLVIDFICESSCSPCSVLSRHASKRTFKRPSEILRLNFIPGKVLEILQLNSKSPDNLRTEYNSVLGSC
jgi:hypothetical protein